MLPEQLHAFPEETTMTAAHYHLPALEAGLPQLSPSRAT